MIAVEQRQVARLARRKRTGRLFAGLFLLTTLVGIAFLAVLLVEIFRLGVGRLDWGFITSYPSRFPDQAGIRAALLGSIWMIAFAIFISLPLGVATAIYLEEYAPRNWLRTVIQVNVSNLAGVPSIIYGLLGLTVFVRWWMLERSVLAGSLTISLLMLPTIIVAAQEALRAVPSSLREGSYALGATRWQTVWHVVLPQALPGIITGNILAVSRALGEAAPLITIGALTFIAFDPRSPLDPFTVLPIQIFNWTSRPQEAFREIAAAGIIVLLILLLSLNAVAILIRNRYQRRSEQ
jgi:phosphate transport system permease protein